MKRVKIMLTSIAVLAVVGGALAFKAKTGPIRACTIPAAIIGGQIVCNPFGQQICPVVTYTTSPQNLLVCTYTPEVGKTECPTELCTVPTLVSIDQ